MRGLSVALFRGCAVLGLCLWSLAGVARAEQVTVFAAASLKTALDQIVAAYANRSETDIVVSYAGTPVLARQISLGAPADVILSASAEWMDWLEARGAIDGTSRTEIAGNRLVLIASARTDPVAPTADALRTRLGSARLAMALVDAVPAGIYGKAALRHLGLWDEIAAQVAQTDNVRAALALVASGAVPFGIVYASDAAADPRVQVLTTFPPESHPPITYPAALVAGQATPEARDFQDYLTSDAARDLLAKNGFLPPAEAS